jgi:hypothetical protein
MRLKKNLETIQLTLQPKRCILRIMTGSELVKLLKKNGWTYDVSRKNR